MISVHDFPHVNASLNAVSGALLVLGFLFVRRKKITAHKTCMISAAIVSVLFLICYVTYHNKVGFTRFQGEGLIRTIYFAILIPHTILASVAVLPLIVITLYQALRGNFERHRRIARWTFPIWLFVSITGVMVYWMLYRM